MNGSRNKFGMTEHMSWIIYSLIGILIGGVSDLFRKLGSGLKDPLFANLVFQIGSCLTAIILYVVLSRKFEYNSRSIGFAFVGGALISVFTLFSFKALSIGPGVSTVMPILRIGMVSFVAVLGVLVLKESLTMQKVFGLLLSAAGIYLLFK